MWILESTDPNQPFTFRLLPNSIKTIGRAPRADFVVDAALVSRLHCRLTLDAAGLGVEDLGSTNGTWVNGRKIARAPLMSGDKLTVGRVEFAVTSQGD
jgi:pSer/pThr/pTyr-binding forkhead associated (FHA) protein